MKDGYKVFIVGFVLFILGFVSIFIYRYLHTLRIPAFSPTPSTTTLVPPQKAITGTLTFKNGEVLHKARTSDDFQEATPGGQIFQGESIATKKGSASLEFLAIGTLFLGNTTELAIANLVPAENSFVQKSGTIQYQANPAQPIAVRALHTLIEISENTTVQIVGGHISIRVTEGSTKLALVDQSNTTRTWTIHTSEQATIDDNAKTVIIR